MPRLMPVNALPEGHANRMQSLASTQSKDEKEWSDG